MSLDEACDCTEDAAAVNCQQLYRYERGPKKDFRFAPGKP
jgi:hypothetical protein